jgi:hypothetical protein
MRFLPFLIALAVASPAIADPLSPWMGAPGVSVTIALPSGTSARSAGTLIANSTTAASVVNPYFTIPGGYSGAAIGRFRVSINDTTPTSWGSQTIQIDTWSASPTWANGDAGAWLPATGAASHLGTYTCVMYGTTAAVWGDGIAGECSINQGTYAFSSVQQTNGAAPSLSRIYVSAQAVSGSGVTGANKTLTITPEFLY